MCMDKLKTMLDRAIDIAEEGLNQDVSCIDAHELGEIIDIVKDLEEAMYYCSIVEAMENADDPEEYVKKYIPEINIDDHWTDETDVKNTKTITR